MTVFDAYAAYYDLIYREKDYAAEAKFVRTLLAHHAPDAETLLDVGCGTGRHAVELVEAGYRVTGVDRAPAMIEAARRLAEERGISESKLGMTRADLRLLDLGRTFDVVVALFHVMSYQRSDEDLETALTRIREHLAPGGVVLFDFWYGPAVLYLRPEVRVKRLRDERTSVVRIAEPVLLPRENVVEVAYTIFAEDLDRGVIERIEERHEMRYLFEPEVRQLLERVGLSQLEIGEWLTSAEPDPTSWSVYVVATRPS